MSRLVMGWLTTMALVAIGPAAPPTSPSPDPSTLAIPPDQLARARELVRQLGSEAYLDRDRAARELARMGRLALPALQESREDADPEVRMRVSALLPRAEADELRARIAAFLADTETRFHHDLPGFARFRAVAGDDREARELYAEILKNRENHDLLLALRTATADPAAGLAAAVGSVVHVGRAPASTLELAEALNARRWLIQHNMAQAGRLAPGMPYRPYVPEIPEMALLLLAESLVSETQGPFNPFQYQVANFLYQESLRRPASGEGKYGPAFRRLVLHWMDTRDGMHGLQNALSLAQNLRLGPEAICRYASRILTVEGTQPWSRANAASMLARHGGREHVFTVTRLLTDETLLVRGGPNNPQPDIQVRDTALAMLVLMTGQSPASYGFDSQFPGNEAMKFQYTNFRFQADEKRSAEVKRETAFARWRTWEGGLHGSLAGSPAAAAMLAQKYPAK